MNTRFSNKLRLLIIGTTLLISPGSLAGFLEMPETTEVPALDKRTLLMDLDIPSVRERDPDPAAGPRLNVKEFRIQGLVEFPEYGITRKEVIKHVEKIRFDLMEEGLEFDTGYTVSELSELSDLLGKIEEETKDSHVTELDLQKVIFLIRDQRRNRGLTLGMIETVADTITQFYRSRGFILARAYIPKQEVRDGIVTLTLLLGELGEVTVKNNKRYTSRSLRKIFNNDIGEPVKAVNVEEDLYIVNDLPGLSVNGYFKPGSQVGDTALNINVLAERRFKMNLRSDNHGAPSTGENRIYSEFILQNPLRLSDQLKVAAMSTYSPDNSTYGSFNYSTKFIHPRFTLGVGLSNNDFVSGIGNAETNNVTTGFEGESVVSEVTSRYTLKRGRKKNFHLNLRAFQVDTNLDIAGNRGSFKNTVRNATLSLNFDSLHENTRTLHNGNFGITYSKNIPDESLADGSGNSPNLQENEFYYTLDYSMLRFMNIPFTSVNSRLVVNSSIQYAGTGLASANQFRLTGATRARGFDINSFFADDAAFLNVEWMLDTPNLFGKLKLGRENLGKIIQPFLFIDGSWGKTYPQLLDEKGNYSTLTNIGLGLKLNYKGSFRGNLMFAKPVDNKIKTEEGIDTLPSDIKFYFDLQYSI